MEFDNLHQILRSLYEQMMPLCEDMAGVAKGIAGLGALFYVAYRVWQSLARAEPIDVFPMLRPFAIGLCIMFFPDLCCCCFSHNRCHSQIISTSSSSASFWISSSEQ